MEYQPFGLDYVQRLTAGDPDAERHFVEYFSELLLIKLRRLLKTGHAIEDVRQETFLRVFRVLKNQGIKCPENLGAFVNGVCNNVVSEHYRAVTRHCALPEAGLDTPEQGPDPEAACVNEERKRRVLDILKKLPAKDREILRLIFIEEREKDDVCRICHVGRGYLRVLLHRAKNRFRDQAPPAQANARSATFV